MFNNKVLSTDAKNYRGIFILPTITKVVETLLRDRIQRGVTKHSSPMNCFFIVEETIREYKDLRRPIYIAFLDAKPAFDVVSHNSLLRKLFNAGVEGVLWSLIIHCMRRQRLWLSGKVLILMFLRWTRVCVNSVSHSLKKGQGSGQKKGTFDT